MLALDRPLEATLFLYFSMSSSRSSIMADKFSMTNLTIHSSDPSASSSSGWKKALKSDCICFLQASTSIAWMGNTRRLHRSKLENWWADIKQMTRRYNRSAEIYQFRVHETRWGLGMLLVPEGPHWALHYLTRLISVAQTKFLTFCKYPTHWLLL